LLATGVRAGWHYVLMAAAMTWMLTELGGTPSLPVLAVSGLVAACCVAASIPWVTRADLAAASQATMSVGMAAMLIAML